VINFNDHPPTLLLKKDHMVMWVEHYLEGLRFLTVGVRGEKIQYIGEFPPEDNF
jgi:hypothetical protein